MLLNVSREVKYRPTVVQERFGLSFLELGPSDWIDRTCFTAWRSFLQYSDWFSIDEVTVTSLSPVTVLDSIGNIDSNLTTWKLPTDIRSHVEVTELHQREQHETNRFYLCYTKILRATGLHVWVLIVRAPTFCRIFLEYRARVKWNQAWTPPTWMKTNAFLRALAAMDLTWTTPSKETITTVWWVLP